MGPYVLLTVSLVMFRRVVGVRLLQRLLGAVSLVVLVIADIIVSLLLALLRSMGGNVAFAGGGE